MSPQRSSSAHRAAAPSRLLAYLVVGLLTTSLTFPAGTELLQVGLWEGEYWPAGLGDDIDASFCIERDEAQTPPWKVTMHLDLDPPGNAQVKFEQLEITDQTLEFRIDLLGSLRECVLEKKGKDELRFVCKLIDGDPTKIEKMTMRKAVPRPDDKCQP